MPIPTTPLDPEGTHPSPYRGCIWVTSHFPGSRLALVHDAEGQLIAEVRVAERFATADLEARMMAWLEIADPLPRAPHLTLVQKEA